MYPTCIVSTKSWNISFKLLSMSWVPTLKIKPHLFHISKVPAHGSLCRCWIDRSWRNTRPSVLVGPHRCLQHLLLLVRIAEVNFKSAEGAHQIGHNVWVGETLSTSSLNTSRPSSFSALISDRGRVEGEHVGGWHDTASRAHGSDEKQKKCERNTTIIINGWKPQSQTTESPPGLSAPPAPFLIFTSALLSVAHRGGALPWCQFHIWDLAFWMMDLSLLWFWHRGN